MPYQDIRAYVKRLEQDNQLKHIDVPLAGRRDDTELQALMRLLHTKSDPPALILNKVQGIGTDGVRTLFNIFGSRRRVAMALECESWEEARNKHARIAADSTKWHKPRIVNASEAPCKDVVVHDVDIARDLPNIWFGKEGAAYITGAVVITKDIDTGVRNVGWYRLTSFVDASHPLGGKYDPARAKADLAGFFWWNPPMSGIGMHIAKANAAGKRLQVACAFMCDPSIHIAAATGLASTADEFEFAGGLRGAPVDLVKCETVDLEVPATAEYVIEGEMIPGEQEPIGWHSNPVGYYDRAHILPIMRVGCITHRKDPFWYSTMEMVPPFDHVYLGVMTIEGELFSDLERKIPEVKNVVVTPNMCYIVQLKVDGAKKPHPEFGKYVLHAVWGAQGRWSRTAKLVVVVGPDVDPTNWQEIEWAIMTRVQPWSDVIINRSGQAMLLDPSPPKNAQGAASVSEQMGIDATIKVPERFTEYAEVSDATAGEVAAIAAKVDKLL
ncbi:MAG: UbiD family decarboxylase [Rhodobacteraceae bacterium]|nr:UbiD family decarboxylase [Paracoccaceae bacterium]